MATKKKKKTGPSDKQVKGETVELTEEQKELEKAKQRMLRMKKMEAAALAGRRRYDWEWVVRNLYLRGYHFARYNRSTSTFTLGTRTKVRIPINLMWAQARAIRNQVTSFRPKWEVLPEKPTEASRENAKYSQKTLDYLFQKLRLKRKLKEVVYHGLYTSIGIWQFDWDEANEEVSISVVDPFDLYIDPNAPSLEEATYVIKAVRKPLNYVKTHPLYAEKAIEQDIKPDPKLASSEYKEFLLKSINTAGEGQSSLEDENEYTILREAQIKEWQDDGTAKIRIMTWTEDCEYPLRDELLETDEFNYEILQADLQPLEIYGESWAKHVMPINRVLDALESNAFEYNHFYAKGRYVIDKGSGVRSIVNEHGQIIEKNPGYTVTSLPLAPLPPTHLQQIVNMRQYMEDVGGLHEVSMGRIPTGVKCVTPDTECLTKEGFKLYQELSIGDEIMTVNPQTLRAEWKPIRELFVYDYEGEMIEMDNRHISAKVTPDHKWLIKKKLHRSYRHELVKTSDLSPQDSIPLTIDYAGRETPIYDDDFVKLVGWVVTEGTYRIDHPGHDSTVIRISQSYKANPEKVDMIRGVVEKVTNGSFSEWKTESNKAITFSVSGETGRLIRTMFPDKMLTYDFINSLTKPQLKLLRDTLVLADGNTREEGTRYFTVRPKEVDTFQYICLLLGENAKAYKYIRDDNPKHQDYWEVRVKTSQYTSPGAPTGFNSRSKGAIKKEQYEGIVWCPNTENQTFVARRDGKVFVTGNSGIGIAELRQADASSQDDLVDAMEDFLVRSAKKIFKIVSENYTSTKLAKVAGPGGRPEYFYVVGGNSEVAKKQEEKEGEDKKSFGEMGLPIAIIGSDNEINVTIGSWLAYTKQARQEELKDLFRLGAIDQETLLQHLEFGSVDEIIDKTRTERLIQLRQQMNPNTDLAAQRQGVDEESLALAENELMDEGTPEPVELEDDHEIHLAIHKEGLNTTKYPELYADHMSEHINLMESMPQSTGGLEALLSATGAAGMSPGMGGPPGMPPGMGGGQPMAQVGPGLGGGIPTPPVTTGE